MGKGILIKSKQDIQQEMITHTASLNIVRNLMRISISEICYIRNIFPEDVFLDGIYAGIPYKKLSLNCGKNKFSKDARLIVSWLQEDVFPAIEKGYIHSVSFCIYSIGLRTKANELLESYTLKIKFDTGSSIGLTTTRTRRLRNGNEETSTSVVGNKEVTKNDVIRTIRSLISMTNALEPLPENRLITMKIVFNESCPFDYKTQYFSRKTRDLPLKFGKEALKIDIGRFCTGYHSVSLKLEALEETIRSKGISETNNNSTSIHGSEPCMKHCSKHNDDYIDDNASVETFLSMTDKVETFSKNEKAPTSQMKTKSRGYYQPSKSEVLEKIVKQPSISIKGLCSMFKNFSHATAKEILNDFADSKVIFENESQNDTFDVHAQDLDFFYDTIMITHGNRGSRKKITERALKNSLNATNDQIKAILLRLINEDLLLKRPTSTYEGYAILHSERSRKLIEKAKAHRRRQERTGPGTGFPTDKTPSDEFDDDTLSQPIYEAPSQDSLNTESDRRKRVFANPITQLNMKISRRKVALTTMEDSSPVW